MKISFSTLGCPDWKLAQVLDIASRAGYDGIELRFLKGQDSLWRLPSFQGATLQETLRSIADSTLAICCVDTSCRFDSPVRSERERWIIEGERMAELAARLHAPGIRVFGDRIQTGAGRDRTRSWIADCLVTLSERIAGTSIEVWLETHGDFSCSSEVLAVLSQCRGIGLVWDPASAFVENGERPLENGMALEEAIRHVHIKDLLQKNGKWSPALTGEGQFPLAELRMALDKLNYSGFLSFEWEKKWHPAIAAPEVAISHFADWFRKNWEGTGAENTSPTTATGACS